jgi:hypothetical protein
MSVKWVAVGYNTSLPTNTIQWSSDGQTWYDASSGGFNFVYGIGGGGGYGIAYDGNNWVASGRGSSARNSILWSSNGKDWYYASSGGFTNGRGAGSVAYGGNIWVAVGNTSGTNSIQWSPDGRTWQDASSGGFLGGGGYYNGVAYDGKGLWVASGNGSSALNSIQWSPDGRTWFDASRGGFDDGGGYNGQGVAYDGNKWIAVGYGSSDQNTIQWSPDGLSWYDVSGGAFDGVNNGNGIASDGKGNWVAVGEGSSPEKSILWSPDGLTWQDASSGGFDKGNAHKGCGIAYDGGKWVAVGEGSTPKKTILWSLDGRTWFDASSGGFGELYGQGVASTRLLPPNPAPLPCFLQGTRILTPTGYKKVEEIESGEYVLTSDNRKVKTRLYRFTISTTEETAPYTIQAGALGDFLPSRDLHVSGNHAVQDSAGVWQIPKFLTKNPQIQQRSVGETVTYYHVECENYFRDNLVAEGVIAESYTNNQNHKVVWKRVAAGYVRRQKEDRKDWWRAVKS